MFGEPRVRTFVHEFIHYEEFLSEGEEETLEPDEIEPPKIYRPPERAQRARA